MDHRQTAHMWGPWYTCRRMPSRSRGTKSRDLRRADSEPAHGPRGRGPHARRESQVRGRSAAARLRVPGFMFHQQERTADNGTSPCFGAEDLADNNTRDFDLLGYRYSLMSNMATAPLNSVLCMIPARDLEEFELFPGRSHHQRCWPGPMRTGSFATRRRYPPCRRHPWAPTTTFALHPVTQEDVSSSIQHAGPERGTCDGRVGRDSTRRTSSAGQFDEAPRRRGKHVGSAVRRFASRWGRARHSCCTWLRGATRQRILRNI